MLIFNFAALAVSCLVGLAAYSFLIKRNISFGLIALPDEHVITHRQPIPLIGGIVIFAVSLISLLVVFLCYEYHAGAYLAGLLPLVALGLYKDRIQRPLSPFVQLIPQCLSMLVLYFYWRQANGLPFNTATMAIFLLAGIVIINSVNFLDVMDGLAGSYLVSAYFVTGIACAAYLGTPFSLIIFSFTGALLAFLIYNWNPARLFMGDLGSFGLTYSLLFVTLSVFPVKDTASLPGLLFIFIVPLFEFCFTLIKRIASNRLPYMGDGSHASLTLLNRGFKSSGIAIYAIVLTIATSLLTVYFFFEL